MHQQIVHDASQFMQLEAEERHCTRKRAKRLRYGIEFVSSLYSEKEVQHYLKQLRPVQEALGHYNDLIIAEEVFRNAAAQQPTARYAAGWVKARQESALREAAQALENSALLKPSGHSLEINFLYHIDFKCCSGLGSMY